MTLPLTNRTIALAEGRQLEELAQMLEKEGAKALRYPLLSILDAPNEGPVLEWLNRLTAGEFEWIVLMTGEGVRRLVALAERHGLRDAVVGAGTAAVAILSIASTALFLTRRRVRVHS